MSKLLGETALCNKRLSSNLVSCQRFTEFPWLDRTGAGESPSAPGVIVITTMAAYLTRPYRASVLLFLIAVSLSKVISLNVVGKPATQSSTADSEVAGLAVDGDLNTYMQTAFSTAEEMTDPWWRLDLETVYCLRSITILNRQDNFCYIPERRNCGYRIIGAIVRAGLNPDHVSNRVIGTITEEQAIDTTRPIEIIANPVVTARYVSVDLRGTDRILHMREVMVGEYLYTEGGDGEVDFTLVTNPALLGQTGDDHATIAAYKGLYGISDDVSFGRQVTTGGSNDLPSGSNQLQHPLLGCRVRQLNLPEEGGIDRTGVFYCEATRADMTNTRIQTIILPKDGSVVHIRPVKRTQIANVGDSVRLEMQHVNAPNKNYRWRHNGRDILTSWNDQLIVSIDDVAVNDGGVYSCFASDQENRQLHGIMRLIVRGCSEGMWRPPSCLNTCRRCYNGGICDDKTGTCICAPGFSGDYCQVFGRNVFGQNAIYRCSDDCRGRLFCLRDPYGCSCAAGFAGPDCTQDCPEGTFGADCKQTCHCAPGDTCSKDTGECSNGVCASSYLGTNCQCSIRPVEVTPTSILQRSLAFSWQGPLCPNFGTMTGFVYKLTDVKSGPHVPPLFNAIKQTVTIDGLMPYTVYSFQVAAITCAETTMYSEPINVTTLEAEPSAPPNVNIQNIDDVSITITWSPPNSPNGIITNYDITYWKSVDAGTQTLRNDVGVSPLVYCVDGLEISTRYRVQVRAKTSAGAGPWSDTVTAFTQIGAGATDAPNNGHVNVAAIILGVLLAIAVIVIIIGCVVWRKRNSDSAPKLDDQLIELSNVRHPSTHGIESPIIEDIERDINEDIGLPSWATGLEIQWQNLTIEDKVLGKGIFGEVRAGSLEIREMSKVAIKTVKGATTTASEDFLVEFKTMSKIKPHPNVVGLIGACIHKAVLYIALEYLPNGNLRDYLRSTRPQQQIIHRDLAARNILLGEDLTAKISDFGLSRGEDIYFQKSKNRVPFRWLAIESLTRRMYKSKSDVWSFGIVLWEIATFGATPYPGIQSKLLAKRLQEGYRMPKPENCADEIYDLMMKCWQAHPSQRPSFAEITAALEKMNDPSDETMYLIPYVDVNHVIKPEFDDN
ncbi:tyrosine-protein kinase receptor Tie-1-like isoform X2 [Patiria miniata]|uniref:receptor protein-tyrosine kinase n=1 Tax=Patiria miniata TaxID=46514 RepID=A0A914BJZ4_PATMI|nr:tyrosine-protein kinase receptor Tie-1-like isoform X2 [Patiria miniata]